MHVSLGLVRSFLELFLFITPIYLGIEELQTKKI